LVQQQQFIDDRVVLSGQGPTDRIVIEVVEMMPALEPGRGQEAAQAPGVMLRDIGADDADLLAARPRACDGWRRVLARAIFPKSPRHRILCNNINQPVVPIGPVRAVGRVGMVVLRSQDRRDRGVKHVFPFAASKERGIGGLQAVPPMPNGGRGLICTPQSRRHGEAPTCRLHGFLDVRARAQAHAATEDHHTLPVGEGGDAAGAQHELARDLPQFVQEPLLLPYMLKRLEQQNHVVTWKSRGKASPEA
jgi:hypothetical protein